MNTVSFTPNQNMHFNIKNNSNPVAFQGLKPNAGRKNIKKTENLVQKLYQNIFLRNQGNVKSINDGYVYTEELKHEGALRISRKFKMWERKPQAVIKDNAVTALREKTVINKDGSVDLEIRDMYTPEHMVSVGYKDVKDNNIVDSGTIKLAYGDRSVEISKQERKTLYNEFESVLNQKFPESPKDLRKLNEKDFNKYLNKFFTTPETTAASILSSPAGLKEQLQTVPRSLPYGIECIMDKLEQLR